MAEKNTSELTEKAAEVLKRNDRGKWTIPSAELYPHQWLWDSCFIAIGLRHLDIDRAKNELESLRRGQWANGMLPDMVFGGDGSRLDEILWDSAISPFAPTKVATSGITQPPMVAEAVWQVGQKLSLPLRRSWFKSMLPMIIGYHNWLYNDRDPTHAGLVTLIHPYESGLDNSPSWVDELKARGIPLWVKLSDKLPVDWLIDAIRRDTRRAPPKQRMSNIEALSFWVALRRLRRHAYDSKEILHKPYLAVQDLAFNCILIRSNICLSEIAKAAGVELPKKLKDSMKRSETALDSLWDEPSGQYYSRSFSRGGLIIEPTIATFLPLYTGVIPQERAERLAKLLNKRGIFKTVWPVASVPLDSAYFDPVKYWQGPAWLNTNWLIIKGLRNYGFHDEADHLSMRTIELVKSSGFREYYNPLNGQGLGAKEFSWTAALTIDLLKN